MKLSKNTFAIKRYGKLMRFANWLQQIPNKVTPAPFRLIQIGSAFWQSRALYVGAKLEIGDKSPYVVITDAVASEQNIDAMTASMDMQMLMGTKGRERTRSELENLFNEITTFMRMTRIFYNAQYIYQTP